MNTEKLQKARHILENADALIIGIGSGLSASGGLNYADAGFFTEKYPQFAGQGFRNILDIQSFFWVTHINKENATHYWSFWAQHAHVIRFQAPVTAPYLSLKHLLQQMGFDNEDKNENAKPYFIITTNGDHQTQKAFGDNFVFAPQGNYGYLQCAKACTDTIIPSQEIIENMLANRPNVYEIREEDVPYCGHCGAFLIPNLRCDNNFIETPHLVNMEKYTDFMDRYIPARGPFSQLRVHPFALQEKKVRAYVQEIANKTKEIAKNTVHSITNNVSHKENIAESKKNELEQVKQQYDKNLVFLELGVGYNTPTIIRFPFNQITQLYKNTSLIRINTTDADVTEKNIGIEMDLDEALLELSNIKVS